LLAKSNSDLIYHLALSRGHKNKLEIAAREWRAEAGAETSERAIGQSLYLCNEQANEYFQNK
jgi:hypothetical protein